MNEIDFSSLGLREPVLSAVREEGYSVPTPIQSESIPALLAGRDLLGIAQTGTGKTAAFALPLIQRLLADPRKAAAKTTRVLVVAPTRELAAQIEKSFAVYGQGSNLTRACVFGGVGSLPQERALHRGVDILVATPGRLLDLIDRGHILLSSVESVVLDEADRMFDMGFIRDVRRIVALLPEKRQTIFFSATMPPEIEAFADPLLKNPVRAAVPSSQPTADRVDQKVLFVSKDNKRHLLAAILREDGFKRVIVFTKTKHGANRLVKQLAVEGVSADAIHANKSQNARTRTMDAFRSGNVDVLVATDLAARGIDVDDVELVVNFDLPNESETYVHRIGRTARAGAEGMAVSFCDAEERPLLRDIERLVGFRIPVELDHPYRLEIEPLRDTAPARQSRPTVQGRGPRIPSQGSARTQAGRPPMARPPRAEGRSSERQEGRFDAPRSDAGARGPRGPKKFGSNRFGSRPANQGPREPSIAELFAGSANRPASTHQSRGGKPTQRASSPQQRPSGSGGVKDYRGRKPMRRGPSPSKDDKSSSTE